MSRVALLVFVLTAPVFGQYNINFSNQNQCGKIVRTATSSVSSELQWPWRVVIYLNKGAGFDDYCCAGTLVTRRHVITTALCLTWDKSTDAVDDYKLSLSLGKFNFTDRHEGTPIIFVKKVTLHPDYEVASRANDLAIIELRDPISYLGWAQPACLWPKDLADFSNIVNKTGYEIGWGYDFILKRSRELKLMKLPVVSRDTCINFDRSFYTSYTSDTTYCAGNRDGTTTRNSNFGEGMLFNSGGTWYIRGVASSCSVIDDTNTCDPRHYVVFTDLAKFLPWIYENISDI